QHTIAHIWHDLLNHPTPSLDDNFFDLGGHSLLLIQAHERLRALKSDLQVLDLFRYPTLRSLAAYLAGEAHDAPAASAEDTPQLEERRAGMSRLKQRRRRLSDESKGHDR
ncbi:phosphopantetheine-binding protein, partial [Streptosporangium sp. NPDC000396]|uniref:phosphopantetheine-binding protein n=1 Tax=Streptosporangium sp. NPDC000396 TaxID=3366185 RepID=UPI0036BB0226